jgi:hypothetical protein
MRQAHPSPRFLANAEGDAVTRASRARLAVVIMAESAMKIRQTESEVGKQSVRLPQPRELHRAAPLQLKYEHQNVLNYRK